MEVTRFKRASGALADQLVGFAKSNIDRSSTGSKASSATRNGSTARSSAGAISCVRRTSTVRPRMGIHRQQGRSCRPGSRVNQRPAVAKVVEQMQHTLANLPDFPALLAQGKIKRQYRDHRLEWMIAGGGLSVVQEGIERGTVRFSRLPG
jgi:glutathione S-transferase/RNA polymerase-associated protein